MRSILKIKSSRVPRPLRPLVPNQPDPEGLFGACDSEQDFATAVSSLCINGVWRTTRPGRHDRSGCMIRDATAGQHDLRIIEAGISDGGNAVELADALGTRFTAFYATDRWLSIRATEVEGCRFLRLPNSSDCFMIIGRHCLYYLGTPNSGGAVNRLGTYAARRLLRRLERAAVTPEGWDCLSLIGPALRRAVQADPRIVTVEWDIFNPWQLERADVIRVANVLNPSYFSHTRLLGAIANLRTALRDGGLLAVVDNRNEERVGLFRRCGPRFDVEATLAGGCEVAALVTDGLP
jgi:hypothetical protein